MADKEKRPTKRLADYSEHAQAIIDQSVPPIGYVPPARRPSKKYVLVMREAPVDVKINVERIAMTDPIGFLSAVMQGQPVEEWAVTPDGKAKRNFILPTMENRIFVAKYFADKLVPYMTRTRLNDIDKEQKKGNGDEDEWNALLASQSGAKEND